MCFKREDLRSQRNQWWGTFQTQGQREVKMGWCQGCHLSGGTLHHVPLTNDSVQEKQKVAACLLQVQNREWRFASLPPPSFKESASVAIFRVLPAPGLASFMELSECIELPRAVTAFIVSRTQLATCLYSNYSMRVNWLLLLVFKTRCPISIHFYTL